VNREHVLNVQASIFTRMNWIHIWKSSSHKPLWILLFVFAIWRLWAATFMPFFWDAPLGLMEPALYIFQHGLNHFFIPSTILAEPPLAPWLLALLWHVTGVSLWSSHLFVAVFVLGAIYHQYHIVRLIAPVEGLSWILALVVLESSWLALSQHLSPDLLLIFFALWAIRCMLTEKWRILAIPLLLLSLLSVRGEITIMGLGIGLVLQSWIRKDGMWRTRLFWKEKAVPFLPAIFAALVFWIGRKIELGYFYFDPSYVSIVDRNILPWQGMIRNILVLGLRLTDMGRIAYWLLAVVTICIYRRSFVHWVQQYSHLSGMILGLLIALLPFTIPFSNPFSTRYFLLHILVGLILLGSLTFSVYTKSKGKALILLLISVSIGSHAIMLPLSIARVWDSSLATLVYFDQVNEAKEFFQNQGISLDDVGFDHTEKYLAPDPWHDRKETDQYLLITHVQNPKDETLDSLDKYWVPMVDLTRYGLFMKAYRKKEGTVPMDSP